MGILSGLKSIGGLLSNSKRLTRLGTKFSGVKSFLGGKLKGVKASYLGAKKTFKTWREGAKAAKEAVAKGKKLLSTVPTRATQTSHASKYPANIKAISSSGVIATAISGGAALATNMSQPKKSRRKPKGSGIAVQLEPATGLERAKNIRDAVKGAYTDIKSNKIQNRGDLTSTFNQAKRTAQSPSARSGRAVAKQSQTQQKQRIQMSTAQGTAELHENIRNNIKYKTKQESNRKKGALGRLKDSKNKLKQALTPRSASGNRLPPRRKKNQGTGGRANRRR